MSVSKKASIESGDRIVNANTETTTSRLLEKLPMILEEGESASPELAASEFSFCRFFSV